MDPEEVTAGSGFTESEGRKWQDSSSRLCLFWSRHRYTMVNKKRGGEQVAYLEKWQCVWKRPEHWRQWVRSPPAMWQTPHTSLTLVSSPPEHWRHICGIKKKKTTETVWINKKFKLQSESKGVSCPHLVSATRCVCGRRGAGETRGREGGEEGGDICDGVSGACVRLRRLSGSWLWNEWLINADI